MNNLLQTIGLCVAVVLAWVIATVAFVYCLGWAIYVIGMNL